MYRAVTKLVTHVNIIATNITKAIYITTMETYRVAKTSLSVL